MMWLQPCQTSSRLFSRFSIVENTIWSLGWTHVVKLSTAAKNVQHWLIKYCYMSHIFHWHSGGKSPKIVSLAKHVFYPFWCGLHKHKKMIQFQVFSNTVISTLSSTKDLCIEDTKAQRFEVSPFLTFFVLQCKESYDTSGTK